MLNYFPPQSPRRWLLASSWRTLQAPSDQSPADSFADPEFDDSAWPEGQEPRLLAGTAESDTAWYRCRFDLPWPLTAGRHCLLRFGGAFLEARAWLNGRELGEHYGYFAPFAADVTEVLLPRGNVLAVWTRCQPEARNLKAKKQVLGVFGDWDCKPYPNEALKNPPPGRVWHVPLGLWQEVSLEETGPVIADWLHLTPEFPAADWAAAGERLPSGGRMRLELSLRNLTATPVRVRLDCELSPANFPGTDLARSAVDASLAPLEARKVQATFDVENPALWWPWTHGEPRLYRCRVEAQAAQEGAEMAASFSLERRCGFREVRAVFSRGAGDDRWEWWLNGRRLFPKGSNYICDFWLDRASPERYAADLDLARQANMDFVRVHAHVERQDFYDLADERGFLVMCDFPLIFCYVFGAPEEDKRFFRDAVMAGLTEMVRLLQSHPSIVLWGVHNEPPWPPDMAWFGEPHRAQANKEVDEEGLRLVAALDPSRPAIAASGEFDEHLYHGWYHGHVLDLRDLRPIFPTEFGAQALPNRDSPFWDDVNTAWPVAADDPTWRYAGFQPEQWGQSGVGLPAAFQSLADYVESGQAYQSFYCRFAVDQWRASKFRPTGGLVHFLFADCFPAITWSVLDYYRLPKAAYHELKAAFAPTHVCCLFEGDYTLLGHREINYRRGAVVRPRLWLVNDDYRVSGVAMLTWRVEPAFGGDAVAADPASASLPKRGGEVEIDLPGSDEPAVLAVSTDLRLPTGRYLLAVELWQQGRSIERNKVPFAVGGGPSPHRR